MQTGCASLAGDDDWACRAAMTANELGWAMQSRLTGEFCCLAGPAIMALSGLHSLPVSPVPPDRQAVPAHQRPDVWVLLPLRAGAQLAEVGVCGAAQEHHMAADCRQWEPDALSGCFRRLRTTQHMVKASRLPRLSPHHL